MSLTLVPALCRVAALGLLALTRPLATVEDLILCDPADAAIHSVRRLLRRRERAPPQLGDRANSPLASVAVVALSTLVLVLLVVLSRQKQDERPAGERNSSAAIRLARSSGRVALPGPTVPAGPPG